MKLELPGPRIDLQFLEHTLVIHDTPRVAKFEPHDPSFDEPKSWELIHPPECPRGCHWWPGAGESMLAELLEQQTFGIPVSPNYEGEYLCYLQYEIEQNGIESLEVSSARPEWLEDVDVRDPSRAQWQLDEWMRLRAGGYVVQGWFTPGGWAGDYYDPDGGIHLIDRLPRRPQLVLVA